jgi:hypothetical protein
MTSPVAPAASSVPFTGMNHCLFHYVSISVHCSSPGHLPSWGKCPQVYQQSLLPWGALELSLPMMEVWWEWQTPSAALVWDHSG